MGRLLLVRHGQASFGAADYDVLSPTGEEQAEVLGRWLAARGVRAGAVVHGRMVRQRRTAELLTQAAGWDVGLEVDPGWDEMDHINVLTLVPEQEDFQSWYEAATDRWLDGVTSERVESWTTFAARVEASLDSLSGREGVTVVVSSGGPVSHVVARLLDAGTPAYRRLAPVVVNASVTTVVNGRRGTTLVAFNEHTHLPADLVTYR